VVAADNKETDEALATDGGHLCPPECAAHCSEGGDPSIIDGDDAWHVRGLARTL